MKKYITPLIFAVVLVVLPSASFAQDSTDDASDAAYNDGLQNTDNGGTGSGFTSWNLLMTENPPNSEAEALVGSASTFGGNAAIMDTSGRSWAVRAFSSVGPLGEAIVLRPYSSIPGAKIQCRAQYVGANTGRVVFGGSFTQVNIEYNHGGNWTLEVPAVTDTGIAATSPIEILYTEVDANTFDIRITELVAPFNVFTQNGVAFSSPGDVPNRIVFESRTLDSSLFPGGEYLIFNSLILNPDGTLPVEISRFELE